MAHDLTVPDAPAARDFYRQVVGWSVEEEGGRVIKSVQGKAGKYVYAAVQDPVGAHVALMPG